MKSLGIIFLLFLISTTSAYAARSVVILSDKNTIQGEELLSVTASISGFLASESAVFKGAFFQEGSTSNYFGYTQNKDNWIKNSQPTVDQLKIDNIDDWDKTLKIKADFSDSGYKGEGDYKLKVGFYYFTSGGNISSVNWSVNSLNITINEIDPTPTPLSPTSTPSPTSVPEPTNTISPSNTPKPTSTPKPTPTTKPSPTLKPSNTPKPIPTEEILPTLATPTGTVLGETTENKYSGLLRWIGLIFGAVGSIMIATAASQIWQRSDTIPPV